MPNKQYIKKQKQKKKQKLYTEKTNIYKQKQTKQQIKQTKRQTVCLSTPPNLNDTLPPMWQEIQYSGMMNQSVQRPSVSRT